MQGVWFQDRSYEPMVPPRAEAVLEEDELIEVHPKTGPPAPPDGQLLLPLAG